MGSRPILKKNIFPHIFDCQPNRQSAHHHAPRPGFEKLNRKRLVDGILEKQDRPYTKKLGVQLTAGTEKVPGQIQQENRVVNEKHIAELTHQSAFEPEPNLCKILCRTLVSIFYLTNP